MSDQSELVSQIANHLRKAEELIKVNKSILSVLENEMACLHQCLERGAKQLNIDTPKRSATVFGGGSKEKPSLS